MYGFGDEVWDYDRIEHHESIGVQSEVTQVNIIL